MTAAKLATTARDYQFLLSAALLVLGYAGFKIVSPSDSLAMVGDKVIAEQVARLQADAALDQRISTLEVKLARTETNTEILLRFRCREATQEQIELSGASSVCSDVLRRAR